MKQFNLWDYLKNPNLKVITRSGQSARIICTDRKTKDASVGPILALVYNEYLEKELCYPYYSDGKACYEGSPLDLFFVPEKKTGWININRMMPNTPGEFPYAGTIYSTEKEAVMNSGGKNHIDTIRIEWNE